MNLPNRDVLGSPAHRPRLTILIPTYNRAECLRLLLGALEGELEDLSDRVTILVADNCSPDHTPEVTAYFLSRMAGLRTIRHGENLGADENFCLCVEQSDADYFWMIGDDDLPRAGAVRHVLDLIERHDPDLIYLQSDWRTELVGNEPSKPLSPVEPALLDRNAFARRVNVWTTFISGMVVRRATFVDGATAVDLRRHAKTNLVQLAWVFGTLARARSLLYVPVACVLATSGNTGGYAVLKVFGENFPAITKQHFGADSAITRSIIRRCTFGYLPGLLWGVRLGKIGRFEPEDTALILRRQLSRYAAYPLLLLIASATPLFAKAALFVCKLVSHGLRLSDGIRHGRAFARKVARKR